MATMSQSLQSGKSRRVRAQMDRIRHTGIGRKIGVPVLLLLGDQDSGKSAFGSNITGIPFPSEGGRTCTRMATEICLSAASELSITAGLVKDPASAAIPRKAMAAISKYKDMPNLDQLPALLHEIHSALGLEKEGSKASGFSKHILRLEISGPDQPELTLVDLPGIIQSATAEQSPEDPELIQELVTHYIKQPGAIVLAVFSAMHDFQSQSARKIIKELGADDRAMGIVTKPDRMNSAEIEARMIAAKQIPFQHGWHVVRNKTKDDCDIDRHVLEENFFSQEVWRQYEKNTLGVKALTTKLSVLLHEKLLASLPRVVVLVDVAQKRLQDQLDVLGPTRETPREQKEYLHAVALRFKDLSAAAVSEDYGDLYFKADQLEGLNKEPVKSVRRLRAAIRYYNNQFALQMGRHGAKHPISDLWTSHIVGSKVEEMSEKDYEKHAKSMQERKTRQEAISWALTSLRYCGGNGLPGQPSPNLITELFQQQSQLWETLAAAHIDNNQRVCRDFFFTLLDHIVQPEEIVERLRRRVINAVKERRDGWNSEFEKLLRVKNQPSETWNPDYTIEVDNLRQRRTVICVENDVTRRNRMQHEYDTSQTRYTTSSAIPSLPNSQQLFKVEAGVGSEVETALRALDDHWAYYTIQLKWFVEAVNKMIIGDSLVRELAASILSPEEVLFMSDEEANALACEPQEMVENRERLRQAIAEVEDVKRSLMVAK